MSSGGCEGGLFHVSDACTCAVGVFTRFSRCRLLKRLIVDQLMPRRTDLAMTSNARYHRLNDKRLASLASTDVRFRSMVSERVVCHEKFRDKDPSKRYVFCRAHHVCRKTSRRSKSFIVDNAISCSNLLLYILEATKHGGLTDVESLKIASLDPWGFSADFPQM